MAAGATDDKVRVNKRAMAAAAVIGGLGAMLMSVAAAIGGLSLLSTCRRWVSQMDPPPREQARRAAGQLRAATSAGVNAWKTEAGTT